MSLPLDAGFVLVKLHPTIQTVCFETQRAIKPALVFYKGVSAPRRGTPRHVITAINSLAERHVQIESTRL